VIVTDSIGNIVQTFSETDIDVNRANENQVIAERIAAIIDANSSIMPPDASIVVSSYADLNTGNYIDLNQHPEFIRYPRLLGDAPYDDQIVLFSGGELQPFNIFNDQFELVPGIARILQYLENEVKIPSQNGFREGMGRAQSVTVYIRPL
jgi:hypothetical protein